MTKLIRVMILCVVSLGLTVSAFAGGKQEGTKAPSGGKKVIGLVQIDLSNPFHIGEVSSASKGTRRCSAR